MLALQSGLGRLNSTHDARSQGPKQLTTQLTASDWSAHSPVSKRSTPAVTPTACATCAPEDDPQMATRAGSIPYSSACARR